MGQSNRSWALVVWVMLNGPPDQLPEWFFPSGNCDTDEPLAHGHPDVLYELNDLVQHALSETGWPLPEVRVGFESDERARTRGGWEYFK